MAGHSKWANIKHRKAAQDKKRGTGEGDDAQYDEIRYEGYGPGGTAIMVDCLTDNRNRTVSEVRHVFTKTGGNLGTDGSVAYMFKQIGVLTYGPGRNEDDLMEAALEAGAEDVSCHSDGSIDVITAADDFLSVTQAMQAANFKADSADVIQQAETEIDVDFTNAEQIILLIDMLEDLDDVQEVHANAHFSEQVMARLNDE